VNCALGGHGGPGVHEEGGVCAQLRADRDDVSKARSRAGTTIRFPGTGTSGQAGRTCSGKIRGWIRPEAATDNGGDAEEMRDVLRCRVANELSQCQLYYRLNHCGKYTVEKIDQNTLFII
jgi:hypothetical protein